GYLLIGMAFGHTYCLLGTFVPNAFQGVGRVTGEWEHFRLTYFSLMTLTTVGYGDISPASPTARSLAAVEAGVGQVYVALLVAELVGKRVAQALSPPPPSAG